jgi:hypothetical protein
MLIYDIDEHLERDVPKLRSPFAYHYNATSGVFQGFKYHLLGRCDALSRSASSVYDEITGPGIEEFDKRILGKVFWLYYFNWSE